jgi:hypothetical protein
MYVIARNAGGRPTLMHGLANDNRHTLCGIDLHESRWSVSYLKVAIQVMLCYRCKAYEGSKK